MLRKDNSSIQVNIKSRYSYQQSKQAIMTALKKAVDKFHVKVITNEEGVIYNTGELEHHRGWDTLDEARANGIKWLNDYIDQGNTPSESRVIAYPAYRAPNQYNPEDHKV